MQHRSVLCRGVTAAVAVAAAAVILAAVPAGAAPGRVPHQPFVVTGKRNGPVDIHGSGVFGTIATLHVPNGAWVVLAKADVVNTTADLTGQRPVTCRLVAGGEVGHGQLMPVGASVDSSEQTMTLSIGHRFTAPGVARLDCRADAATGDMQARFIRMQAVKAGKFTDETIGEGGSTSGAGKPVIVSGNLPGPVDVTNADGQVAVAELTFPDPGPYFIAATAQTSSPPGSGGASFTCDLTAEGDFDQVEGGVSAHNAVGDRLPITLTVVHSFAGEGVTDLKCSVSSSGTVRFTNVEFTAIHAGKLTNIPIGFPSFTTGSGAPRIISAFDDGPTAINGGDVFTTIGSMHVAAGRWVAVAKLYPKTTTGGGLEIVQCRLVVGGDVDSIELRESQPGTIDNVQPTTLIAASTIGSGGGDIRVRCTTNRSTGDVSSRFLKITAMKAGSLEIEPLA